MASYAVTGFFGYQAITAVAVQYYNNVDSTYLRVTALDVGRSGFSKDKVVRNVMWGAV
jgi:hypothetical protein